jgi:hypothetical protein
VFYNKKKFLEIKNSSMIIKILLLLSLYLISQINSQPSSPIGSRPVLPTPTTPINTEALAADLGTPSPFTKTTEQNTTIANCQSKIPRAPEDCTNLSSPNQFCCYMYPSSGGSAFCHNIGSEEMDPFLSKYEVNGFVYSVECGVNSARSTIPFGSASPDKAADCSTHSIINNSCCNYKQGNVSYCFWLGSIGRGKITPNVNCNSDMIKLNNVLIIFVILNLFLNFL